MRYFLCIVLPPLAVFTTARMGAFILNLVLTLCFWLPGAIHAFFVVNRYYADKRNRELIRSINQR